MVRVHAYFESDDVALQVRGIAPVRFDHESETFARLSCQNITESMGVAGNITNGAQFCVVESDAKSFRACIRRTQGHGKSVIAENAINEQRVTSLQRLSIVESVE